MPLPLLTSCALRLDKPVGNSLERLFSLSLNFSLFLRRSVHAVSRAALSYVEKGRGATLYEADVEDSGGGRGDKGSSMARGEV